MNSYLKGDTSIPISDTYNDDFDRMQRQFFKYLAKERSMESSSSPNNFAGDPLKNRESRNQVWKWLTIDYNKSVYELQPKSDYAESRILSQQKLICGQLILKERI
jgi:hypothetical protein